MVFRHDPLLADAPATKIATEVISVDHKKGKATPVKIVFADLKPEGAAPSRQPYSYYCVVNGYRDKQKKQRVIGTGDFNKVFTKGAPDEVSPKLVTVKSLPRVFPDIIFYFY